MKKNNEFHELELQGSVKAIEETIYKMLWDVKNDAENARGEGLKNFEAKIDDIWASIPVLRRLYSRRQDLKKQLKWEI